MDKVVQAGGVGKVVDYGDAAYLPLEALQPHWIFCRFRTVDEGGVIMEIGEDEIFRLSRWQRHELARFLMR